MAQDTNAKAEERGALRQKADEPKKKVGSDGVCEGPGGTCLSFLLPTPLDQDAQGPRWPKALMSLAMLAKAKEPGALRKKADEPQKESGVGWGG